ncbi:PREDICTED: SAM50-like protein SPAC17C9.06 [Tarenaya hassleriana]|uniref:SAM50-like protein SPAC17C9.06 n=1 Tax=Tarenaya hassleriana TaxID=28532 RepID=UPI00053C89DC|nr:PREDICTED: SAM50-like protein SPAC17C9.06 [Tarenaya hassleriana]
MAIPMDKPDPNPPTQVPDPEEEEDELEEELTDDDEDVEEEEEDDDESTVPRPGTREGRSSAERLKAQSLFRRMRAAPVPVRVHDVIVRGNGKTKDHVIEAEVEVVRHAKTLQELLEASRVANFNLQALEIFDSVNITLDSGPPELPGSTNVVIDVVESKNPLSGQIGAYTKAQARSASVEASLKYKNIFGYGDIWDGSLAYGCDNSAEVSLGLFLPRFKGYSTPLTSRLYLLTQDWLKFSSYKERSLGLSLGLLSREYHDLVYTVAWRNLIDPSQMASRSVRRQLGHNLLSTLKYTFKYDQRNSFLRPTRGYAFVSTSQIGGLAPDSRTLRFLRQDIDLRYAVPLGFYRAALNFGVSGGIVFPWGSGYQTKPSSLPERFFLGGNSSPVCSLGGPSALWGFKTRGLGPNEPRRELHDESIDPSERDFVGGDFAVTAFADLSFDFPLRWFRDRGIHGHVFACAGNLGKLSENEFRNFTAPKFLETSRTSVGVGIVLPTNLFRMELNYCHILRKQEQDRAKSGFFMNFSAPS